MKNKIKWAIVLSLLCTFALGSCMKGLVEEYPDNYKTFAPRNVKISGLNTNISVSWDAMNRAKGYVVELIVLETEEGSITHIADTANFESTSHILRTTQVDSKTLSVSFSELPERTLFLARIKALNSDPEYNSRKVWKLKKTGAFYSDFIASNSETVGYNSIRLRWKDTEVTRHATTITYYPTTAPTQSIQHPLTDQDKIDRYLDISGLDMGKGYTFEMRINEAIASKTKITTARQPSGAIYLDNNVDFKATLEDPANADKTFILYSGKVYTVNNGVYGGGAGVVNIKHNIILMGEPGKPKPKVYITQFNINGDNPTDLIIDSIKVRHIEFSGYTITGTKDSYTENTTIQPNDMLFAYSNNSVMGKLTLKKLEIESCYVRNYHNGLLSMRVNSGSTIKETRFGTVLINNSLFYDLGRTTGNFSSLLSFSLNTTTNVGCESVTVKNSTIVNTNSGLVQMGKMSTIGSLPTPTVLFENCTLDKIGEKCMDPGITGGQSGQRAVVHLNGFTGTSTFRNCVIGTLGSWGLNGVVNGVGLAVDNCAIATDNTLAFGSATKVDISTKFFPGRAKSAPFSVFDYAIPASYQYVGLGDPRWETK